MFIEDFGGELNVVNDIMVNLIDESVNVKVIIIMWEFCVVCGIVWVN